MTLAAASPNAMGGPFSANYPATRPSPAVADGVAPSRGGGLSKGGKDTAIAVPIILGALIAAGGFSWDHVFVDLLFHLVCGRPRLHMHVSLGLCQSTA